MSKTENKYYDLNDWLGGMGFDGTRLEQFYEEVAHLTDNNIRNYAILLKWLHDAFEAGRLHNDTTPEV